MGWSRVSLFGAAVVLASLAAELAQGAACGPMAGFMTFTDTDNSGDVIGIAASASIAMQQCAANPTCVAFNSSGAMMRALRGLRKRNSCLYTKSCPYIPGYIVLDNTDRQNPSDNLVGTTSFVDALNFCRSQAVCKSVTSTGAAARAVSNVKQATGVCFYGKECPQFRGYISLINTDSSESILQTASPTRAPAVCSLDSRCTGFSTRGATKGANSLAPSNGVCFYIRGTVGCPAVPGFLSFFNTDSTTLPLTSISGPASFAQLGLACANNPSCQGFTTLSGMRTAMPLDRVATIQPMCSYVKECPLISGYIVLAHTGHSGDDIARVPFRSALTACNSQSDCKGVTSDGAYKSAIAPLAASPGTCLYSKIIRDTAFCPPVPGYVGTPGMDDPVNNLNVSQTLGFMDAVAACWTAGPACKGLTSLGVLKSGVSLTKVASGSTCFYSKDCPPIRGYTALPGTTRVGDDIGSSTFNDAFLRCTVSSSCRAFNNYGFYKRSVSPLTTDTGMCLYIKACPVITGYYTLPNTAHAGDNLGIATSFTDAATLCSANTSCRGFSSDKSFKSVILPLATATSSCFYAKGPICPPVAGFLAVSNQDRVGTGVDLGKGVSFPDGVAKCQANAQCQGVNTLGVFKRSATPLVPAESTCFYIKGATKCPRPASFCTASGLSYRELDCDGDGLLDLACNSPFLEGRQLIRSSTGCVLESNVRPEICPAGFGPVQCPRPAIASSWCTEIGSDQRQVDCDGDGITDLTCETPWGYRSMVRSSRNCSSVEVPTSPQDCPAAWGCYHPSTNYCQGGTYKLLDCDGDGLKDLTCVYPDGRRELSKSTSRCTIITNPPVASCPAAFGPQKCTRPAIAASWCMDSGVVTSGYKEVDCDGDGILDLTCETPWGYRSMVLSSRNCSSVQAPTTLGDCPAAWGCFPPYSNYCQDGILKQVDCDGDDLKDLACVYPDGERELFKSTDRCSVISNPPVESCPAAFGESSICDPPSDEWCTELGSTLKTVDCNGDGVLDLACITQDGQQSLVMSWKGCELGTPEFPSDCPAAFGCRLPEEDWCEDGTYRYVDCDGDKALDSVCIYPDGGNEMFRSTNLCDYEFDGDESLCPLAFGPTKCARPSAVWCNGLGFSYKEIDCDSDGVTDLACIDPADSRLMVRSSRGCGFVEVASSGDNCPAAFGCFLSDPEQWCAGTYMETDCDRDGLPDATCIKPDGTRTLMRSMNKCRAETNVAAETCPDAFGYTSSCPIPAVDWCEGLGLEMKYVNCDDDDVLDLTCEGPAGLRQVVMSSRNCTLMSPESTSDCPASFGCYNDDPDPCPGGDRKVLDCDDDGIDDDVCVVGGALQYVLLSSKGCVPDLVLPGQAPAETCPRALDR